MTLYCLALQCFRKDRISDVTQTDVTPLSLLLRRFWRFYPYIAPKWWWMVFRPILEIGDIEEKDKGAYNKFRREIMTTIDGTMLFLRVQQPVFFNHGWKIMSQACCCIIWNKWPLKLDFLHFYEVHNYYRIETTGLKTSLPLSMCEILLAEKYCHFLWCSSRFPWIEMKNNAKF